MRLIQAGETKEGVQYSIMCDTNAIYKDIRYFGLSKDNEMYITLIGEVELMEENNV